MVQNNLRVQGRRVYNLIHVLSADATIANLTVTTVTYDMVLMYVGPVLLFPAVKPSRLVPYA